MTQVQPAQSIRSRLYAWVRTTGKYKRGGWACASTHPRVIAALQSLELDYTCKGRAVWFTLLDDNQEMIDFWSTSGIPFLEEIFVIKNLTACKSSIQLKSNDDEMAFMLLTDMNGYVYESTGDTVMSIYKK